MPRKPSIMAGSLKGPWASSFSVEKFSKNPIYGFLVACFWMIVQQIFDKSTEKYAGRGSNLHETQLWDGTQC